MLENMGQVGRVGRIGTLEHREGFTQKMTGHLSRAAAGGFKKQCEGTCGTSGATAEEVSNVRCSDDITGKELPWTAVRRAREDELKYFGDRCVRDC